jgi:hypothetical protein
VQPISSPPNINIPDDAQLTKTRHYWRLLVLVWIKAPFTCWSVRSTSLMKPRQHVSSSHFCLEFRLATRAYGDVGFNQQPHCQINYYCAIMILNPASFNMYAESLARDTERLGHGIFHVTRNLIDTCYYLRDQILTSPPFVAI